MTPRPEVTVTWSYDAITDKETCLAEVFIPNHGNVEGIGLSPAGALVDLARQLASMVR